MPFPAFKIRPEYELYKSQLESAIHDPIREQLYAASRIRSCIYELALLAAAEAGGDRCHAARSLRLFRTRWSSSVMTPVAVVGLSGLDRDVTLPRNASKSSGQFNLFAD